MVSSKVHLAVAFATRLLSWSFFTTLSGLVLTWHIILPVFLLAFVYHQVYLYWFAHVGSGIWAPAWPVSRTRLVLTMITLPIWAACMASGMFIWAFSKQLWTRTKRYKNDYRQMPIDIGAEQEEGHGNRIPRYHLLHAFRRHLRWRLCLAIYLAIVALGVFLLATYELPGDIRYRPDLKAASRDPKPEGYGNGEKIFIAAMFYNNERVIPFWSQEMLQVIQYIGIDNTFVSIVESNSGDNTAALLEEFAAKLTDLNVPHRVLTQDTSILRPDNMDTGPPRIKFLAAVRNLVLEPLVQKGGYDRILYSNDVFVSAESIVELLKTRDGDWDMVCGLDLSFWGLYDAWVTRDRLGRLVSSLWPYLLEDAGMKAVMHDEPAPVFTCWNGIVGIRVDPFLPIPLRSKSTTKWSLSTSPLPNPLPVSHPNFSDNKDTSPALSPPLQFRASSPTECFSSEAFNLPYDLRRQFDLQKIYVNPRVITSYDWSFYVWYKYVTRHWVVKWWIENVEKGSGMHLAKMVIGNPDNVWRWDGGECHPWS